MTDPPPPQIETLVADDTTVFLRCLAHTSLELNVENPA